MTAREKAEIRTAIKEIMSDDAEFYMEGVERLCKLVGLDYPAARLTAGAKRMTILDLASMPNQSFEVNLKGTK